MTTPFTAAIHPPQPASPQPAREGLLPRRSISFLFALLVAAFCCWVFSLPLFPTQDGPMHKYYVHAIASLLSHSHAYDAYVIRHPLPPYAIHYAILLVLAKIFTLDMAEKILVCAIIVVTAYSFRYCARSIGPSGDLMSLLIAPLLLHWPIVMGFLNYSLAAGLFFLAVGLWVRAGKGQAGLWIAFLFTVLILTLAHPVPLLLLIVFCALDLMLKIFGNGPAGVVEESGEPAGVPTRPAGKGLLIRRYRRQLMAFAFACLSFLYPLASADRSRSVQNLSSAILTKDRVISTAALFGLSLFDTRSTNLFINLYRLGLYGMLFGCLGLAALGLAKRWRTHTLTSGDTLLIGAIAVGISIPILPPEMNGSDYFAQRLMIFPWLAIIAAAAGYPFSQRLSRLAPAISIVMCALTLGPAEHLIRPVARQLAALEAQPLPHRIGGLAILDPATLQATRREHHLGFDPYLWSAVLPFIHADDVMLNSPWMDLTIMPVKAAPGARLLINQIGSTGEAARMINGNLALPEMPSGLRASLLASTGVIVLVAVPEDVNRGLAPLIGPGQAMRYRCTAHEWYLICAWPARAGE